MQFDLNKIEMQLYQIGKLLGTGSYGQVFLCRHKKQARYYAMKKMRVAEMEPQILENIQNQLKLLQKLRHNNIVSFKDSFTNSQGELCIILVYCEAGDLSTKIRTTKQKGKNFGETQIIDWIVQICLAIHYLHHQKILHRDLKPHNLFLMKDGRIKLGDFGISKVLDSVQEISNTCMIGTPPYMAPQIFKGKPYSYKSDIWSLGCIIYELCNLRRPFDAQSKGALALKIIQCSYPSIFPTYSKQLRDLIKSMLNVKAHLRPTIVEILQKPFIRSRLQRYMSDILNHKVVACDIEDVYLDSLKEQANLLEVEIENKQNHIENEYSQDVVATNYSVKWNKTFMNQSKKCEQSVFNSKRNSLVNQQILSFKKKKKANHQSSTMFSLDYKIQEQCQAFVDHKKNMMMQNQPEFNNTIGNLEKQRSKSKFKQLLDKQKLWMEEQQRINRFYTTNAEFFQNQRVYRIKEQSKMNREQEENQYQEPRIAIKVSSNGSRKFKVQQEYSMEQQVEQMVYDNQLNSRVIDGSIIYEEQEYQHQVQQEIILLTEEDEQEVPLIFNKNYYRILDQVKLLKYRCQNAIGTQKYLRACQAVKNGQAKAKLVEILGIQMIGYWHLIDQIMFNEAILKTLPKN